MRKLAYTFILLLSLTGCRKDPSLFTLHGEIQNFGNGTILIYGLPGTNKQLDTISVKEGKFKYSFAPDTLTPLILHIDEQTEYPILANKGWELTLDGEKTALDRLQIRGNNENEELNTFYLSLRAMKDSTDEIILKADSFIRRHPLSPASIYILDTYFVRTENPDYKRIIALIESMSGELKDHPYIKQIDEQANQLVNVAAGKYAPAFTAKNIDGKTISSADYKDKYWLLHFWASWNPQPEETAVLRKLEKKYKKEKRFSLVGLSLDIDRKAWTEALRQDSLNWEQVSDLKGWNSSVALQYGIKELPTYVLIGPDRKIIARHTEAKELDRYLEELGQ